MGSTVLISNKYPSGYKVKMSYSTLGELTQVTNDAGTVVVFKTPKVNQRGQYVSYQLGDTKTTSFTYDAFGALSTISAPGVQNYGIVIDPNSGNVNYRKDYLKKRIENFDYDNVNRLATQKVSDYTVFTPPTIDAPSVEYAANGNITKKVDVGTYTYDNTKIHAVVNVQNSSNTISYAQQDIKYDYDRTIEIKEGANRLTFKYGPDLNRIKTELYQNEVKTKTKYFIGGYEKEVTPTGTREVHYIPTGNGSSAVYVVENGVVNYYYLYKDHLGSVVAVTNKTGSVVYEQSFDAWGKQRNPQTWNNTTFTKNAAFSWLGGFTGHEMLNEFGLVNMNNRMYDPTLGRMLAPDNLVQNPTYTQNYNRYSYVYNNPMRYTDPSGEFIIFSDLGFELQKTFSPIAFHIDLRLGEQKAFGFDASIGFTKLSPLSYRYNFGKSYFSNNYGSHTGWETRNGGEWSLNGYFVGIPGSITMSGTTFGGDNYPRSQSTNMVTYGNPFDYVSYENDTGPIVWDLPGVPKNDHESDAYRTAALKVQHLFFNVGFNIHTGEAKMINGHRQVDDKSSITHLIGGSIGDESQSYGVLYMGSGPFRSGIDTECIRQSIQNKFAHDFLHGGTNGSAVPWILKLNRKNRNYFQFGYSNGTTLY